MTLADYRGIKRPRGDDQTDSAVTDVQDVEPQHAREAAVPRERAHPGPLEYAKIGLALAVVTAVEVALFYTDLEQGVLIGFLIVLSAIKFSLVALWFMHLRFDSRLFSGFFVGGLVLAVAIFVIVLASLSAGLV
ncbi:MAG: cytochrome C oxidase subunit IV family protein [Anaerolineae bacterium]